MKTAKLVFEPQLPMYEAASIRVVLKHEVLGEVLWDLKRRCYVFEPSDAPSSRRGYLLRFTVAELEQISQMMTKLANERRANRPQRVRTSKPKISIGPTSETSSPTKESEHEHTESATH